MNVKSHVKAVGFCLLGGPNFGLEPPKSEKPKLMHSVGRDSICPFFPIKQREKVITSFKYILLNQANYQFSFPAVLEI